MTGRVRLRQQVGGVAGDMLLGAGGCRRRSRRHRQRPRRSRVDGYALTFERVQRGGIAHAGWANVVVDQHGREHRPVRAINALLDAADLPDAVQDMARQIFAMLADAEGAVHGIDPADVELHEVGALDAIVDVVGVAAALHSLGIEQIVASPIAMGHGMVGQPTASCRTPPPAVAELLAQRQSSVIGVETSMGLATPRPRLPCWSHSPSASAPCRR